MTLCLCWEQPHIPEGMRVVQEKRTPQWCNNHRSIFLLSIVGRVFIHVFQAGLWNLTSQVYPESQCGFRVGQQLFMIFFLCPENSWHHSTSPSLTYKGVFAPVCGCKIFNHCRKFATQHNRFQGSLHSTRACLLCELNIRHFPSSLWSKKILCICIDSLDIFSFNIPCTPSLLWVSLYLHYFRGQALQHCPSPRRVKSHKMPIHYMLLLTTQLWCHTQKRACSSLLN